MSSPPGDDPEVIPELRGYPPVMTTGEVAEALSISVEAVLTKRLRRGEWPGFHVGREWRVRRSVVQAIILGRDPWEGTPRPAKKGP